ncbi:MAG: ABC transporter ATP-binding protein [Actinomycetes bacterium]
MSVETEQAADRPSPEARQPLVRVSGVKKYFPITQGIIFQREVGRVHAVDGVSLEVFPGETLGIVGETGCGKSTLARLICRLLPVTEGTIEFDGQDITNLKGNRLRQLRREIQMIFQDPYSSLNPRKRVGAIIGDPFEIHGLAEGKEQKKRVQELMETVGLNPEHYNRFPAEFSGGQRQRIGVARALALRPKLVICDEPVSALDVSIQAQVINLLEDLQNEFKLTYIFIAHDLSVVRHVSDRVGVMYLGKVVELSDAYRLYAEPKHPYTGALLSAIPVPDPDLARQRERVILLGDVPSPIDPPSGCRFHPRCPKAQERCVHEEPPLEPKASGDLAACHFPLEPGENLARAKAGIEQEMELAQQLPEHPLPPTGDLG